MRFKLSLLSILVAGTFAAHSAIAAPVMADNGVAPIEKTQQANSWLEINLSQFDKNIKDVKSHVKPNVKVCAIMKADAYGNGISGLMPTILANNIPCIGVTSNEEMRVVREAGFKGELVRVRAASMGEIEGAVQYNVQELVGDINQAKAVAAIAKRANRPIKIHLALNHGGMSRNGVDTSTKAGMQEATNIIKTNGIEVVGMMTHFPNYDREEVLKKSKIFYANAEDLIKQTGLKRENVTIHAANSFTTLNVPEAHFDMVRPGGVLYGDQPTNPEFAPIFTFKTKVASLMNFPKGATVGYDSTVTLKRNAVLANLPIGYSDSYPRKMGNTADVLVNGKRAKVTGMISMNTTMVDVTDIKGIKAGDEVVLFGTQGKESILAPEIEKHADVIFPEIYTQWGKTNNRVYVN